MMNFVLTVKMLDGSFYGGSIQAPNIDAADEFVFTLSENLKDEGFLKLVNVDVMDYFEFKGSLPKLNNERLNNYIAYYCLDYNKDVEVETLDGLIQYFEKKEEYEKCSYILKKKQSLKLMVA